MKTIDIITSNNVTIQYELGSITQRFFALLLDLVIVSFYYLFVYFICQLIIGGVDDFAPSTATWVEDSWNKPSSGNESYFFYMVVAFFGVLFAAILYVPVFFYRFLCEYFFAGRTVGKMAAGLRVLRLDGSVPSASEYFLRNAFMLIDLWMTVGSMGFLFSSSSEKNQRLGDMVSNTTVIRLNSSISYSIKDILSIKTAKDYKPQYPQVVQLTDDDMLLIKNALDRVRRFPNKQHKSLIVALSQKSQELLKVEELPKNKLVFLKTLLQDYIVLTRS